jgi:hypothetical protein
MVQSFWSMLADDGRDRGQDCWSGEIVLGSLCLRDLRGGGGKLWSVVQAAKAQLRKLLMMVNSRFGHTVTGNFLLFAEGTGEEDTLVQMSHTVCYRGA